MNSSFKVEATGFLSEISLSLSLSVSLIDSVVAKPQSLNPNPYTHQPKPQPLKPNPDNLRVPKHENQTFVDSLRI